MKVAFKTLGCRLNQHETDALVSSFDKKGYDIVDFKQSSDITVINTCTVTGQSDHKSRNIIQQAISANPGSTVVVTGCMAEQYQTDLEKIPGVSIVANNVNKSNIVDLVESHLGISEQKSIKPNVFNYQPIQKSMHTRAAIKVQDGCDNRCTFCIIPDVRGRATSRPAAEIVEGIKNTLANGYKEIVVTGVNIGRYYDNGIRFTQLMQMILDIPGDFRVRISSLEPDGFGKDFIALFDNPKLAPHLHLCIQSGSEQILLKMRRMYSIESYREFSDQLLEKHPTFNLTTDIIVGFPTETDHHFKETLNIVKQIGFSHVHTFKYSIRKGTPAARMTEQIDEKIKTKRSEQIRTLSDNNKRDYYKQFIGKTERVLVEKDLGDGWYSGYGEHYIPVIFKHFENLKNQFINIKIDGFEGGERIQLKGNTVAEHITLKKPVFVQA